MQFSTLIDSFATQSDNARRFHVPEDWMQGRTTYGGLTAAMCLKAALPLAGDRPVRSAQIAFVGPVSGDVECRATLLREGKNTVFTHVRMTGEDGVAADAIFAFGASRESTLNYSDMVAPELPAPDETQSFFGAPERRPRFALNFNMRLAEGDPPISGAQSADMHLWMRHKEDGLALDAVSLLAIADAPPPAAMAMMRAPGRISSMTWMAEFLTDQFETENGWVQARHTAQTAQDGYSSQAMRLWNTSGKPLMVGRQTIAVFA